MAFTHWCVKSPVLLFVLSLEFISRSESLTAITGCISISGRVNRIPVEVFNLSIFRLKKTYENESGLGVFSPISRMLALPVCDSGQFKFDPS